MEVTRFNNLNKGNTSNVVKAARNIAAVSIAFNSRITKRNIMLIYDEEIDSATLGFGKT